MLGVLTLIAFPVAANTLRVCADPDNMPYSRRDGSGFENRIAALLAEALGATLEYFWFPDRRGYLRKTLDARECDVVMSVSSVARPARGWARSGSGCLWILVADDR